MSDYSRGEFLMHIKEGIKMTGDLSPWLRFCIGAAILMLAAVPLINAIRWW